MNIKREFASWHDFVEYAGKANPDDKTRASLEKNEWFGFSTFEEAINKARTGWKEGWQKVERFRARLLDNLQGRIIRPKVTFDCAGAYVDISRFLSGEPEHFANPVLVQEQAQGGAVVSVAVVASYSCEWKPNEIERRGATIMAFIDALEQAGKRIEIILYYCTMARNQIHEISVKAKHANQALDRDSMTYALVSPASPRRIAFAVKEQESHAIRCLFGFLIPEGAYGYPTSPKNIICDFDFTKVSDYGTQFRTDEQAQVWLDDELRKAGVLAEC